MRESLKIPVILDTDIGDDIDDLWALVMLLRSPQADVRLVTTTFGRQEYRGKLLARLLTAAGRADIPIGLGAGDQQGDGRQRDYVTGYDLKSYTGKIHGDGVQALIDTIHASPKPLTIIGIGPLHTVGAAIQRDPAIAGKAHFVGMLGSVRKGYDGGPEVVAEWNVKMAITLCQTVLSAPWKSIALTPLDTCGIIRLAGAHFAALRDSKDPLTAILIDNYRMWAGKQRAEELTESSILFDTVAVYLALYDRALAMMEDLKIRVTDDGFTRPDEAGRMMSVATDWRDLNGYYDLLVKVLDGK